MAGGRLSTTTPLAARGVPGGAGATGPGRLPAAKKGSSLPSGGTFVAGRAVVSQGSGWSGGALQAGTILSVPLGLGVLVVAFMVVQWLVDRRDPKLVDAPAHKDEDTVGFE